MLACLQAKPQPVHVELLRGWVDPCTRRHLLSARLHRRAHPAATATRQSSGTQSCASGPACHRHASALMMAAKLARRPHNSQRRADDRWRSRSRSNTQNDSFSCPGLSDSSGVCKTRPLSIRASQQWCCALGKQAGDRSEGLIRHGEG